jgi:hypothetical protein
MVHPSSYIIHESDHILQGSDVEQVSGVKDKDGKDLKSYLLA